MYACDREKVNLSVVCRSNLCVWGGGLYELDRDNADRIPRLNLAY